MYDWTLGREKWMTKMINDTPYEPVGSYYLTGIGFGGWGAKDYELKKSADGNYTIDVTLLKDTEYSFKIFDGYAQNYYTADLSDETTSDYLSCDKDNYNATITPTEDLDVTIIFDGYSFILRLNDYKSGDVNLDSKVNVLDATEIQKHLASIISFTDRQITLADVDSDGKITIKDSTQIQRITAGRI